MQIVNEMGIFPQRDFFTLNPKVKPVIDTGIDREDWGRVYIGLDYLHDLATLAGYVKKSELDSAQATIASLEEDIGNLIRENDITLEKYNAEAFVEKIKELVNGMGSAIVESAPVPSRRVARPPVEESKRAFTPIDEHFATDGD